MKVPITTVVPQPGATFPYSELSGFKAVPNGVTLPFVTVFLPFDVVAIIEDQVINCFQEIIQIISCLP